ncbi:MAG: hypothetical protein Q9213_005197 [Squamulea squamosa]
MAEKDNLKRRYEHLSLQPVNEETSSLDTLDLVHDFHPLANKSSMSLFGRIFADDEELGKKDDDRRSGRTNLQIPAWSARKPTPWRRRRVLYGLIACIALYLFVKNIPEPDHPPVSFRPQYSTSPRGVANSPQKKPKTVPETSAQKPPLPDEPLEVEKHYYDGPIRFYSLAASLYAVSRLRGQFELNRNVLFVASNLRSASELIPIACEMATWDRNDVHFAVMGRDDLDLDDVKLVNGVDEECKVNWHDARPDFSPWSTDFRMEVSVAAALGHIQTFMHPQVVIMDDHSREDAFFTKAIRAKTSELGQSVIELPKDASEKMMWIARLDSGSLAAWQTSYVDILIHAPTRSSGSLIRLLRSIESADYFGHRRPHLTIELPAEIDPPTRKYLDGLVWPPVDPSAASHTSQVTLRHRIPRRASTVEEASIRHVESFYPARPADSHVLILSPQVELSPIYFHFLMYHLLEYKYVSTAPVSSELKSLMGLSLELPNMHLNESLMFNPPMIRSKTQKGEDNPGEPTPFLWQAPNSNAALYFGDKWVEFHSFLTSRVSLDPAQTPERPNLISRMYPSWLEYILELMRARGYTLLYPNFPSDRQSVATVHYELFHPPEEISKPKSSTESGTSIPSLDPRETFPTDPNSHRPKHSESTPLKTKLISLLPSRDRGTVRELSDLPLLSHEGNELSTEIFKSFAHSFSSDFRREVSLCSATYKPKVEPMKADDLFCDNNNEAKAGGLSLGDLNSDQPFAWRPPKSTQMVNDDDEIRQSEFEAHLNRQAGKKGEEKDVDRKANEKEDGDEKSENMKAVEGKAKSRDSLKKAEKEQGVGVEDVDVKSTKSEPKEESVGKSDKPKNQVAGKEITEEKSPSRDRGW